MLLFSMTLTFTAIGLMSGTSLDGIDAALLETDGNAHVRPLAFVTLPYDDTVRAAIRAAYGCQDRTDPVLRAAEEASTTAHIAAVRTLLEKTGKTPGDIDIIGYHGQTVYHAPKDGITIQIGDGEHMADETGIDVVYDMRTNDVAQGGEGAPLAPIYHWARALSAKLEFPAVILNIGGVANVTYLDGDENNLLAFDTGPGNALLDDWMQKRTGARFDEDGKLASAGTVQTDLLNTWLDLPYFKRMPPKSLDRDEWDIAVLGPLVQQANTVNDANGAATLLAFTAETIIAAQRFMPAPPKAWYVCGGGRHNKALMAYLHEELHGAIADVDTLGWDGDATEAECFAYLGVRSKLGLPLSFPGTTGCKIPLTGGKLARPARSS